MSEKNELDKELQKTIFRELKNRRIVPLSFDSILDTDLAYMELLSTFRNGVKYSLYAIDIFRTHACAVCSTNKAGFSKILSMNVNTNWLIIKMIQ